MTGLTMPWDEPTLATAGHIKIGGLGEERKKRNGKGPNDTYRMPIKLNHMLITKTTRNAAGDLEPDIDLMSELEDLYGEVDGKTGQVVLRQIPIVLHSDDLDEVFPTSLALYRGKSLFCSGDGVRATMYRRDDAGRVLKKYDLECPCAFSSLANPDGQCKPHATLNCSIRAPGRGLFGSVYRWRTTSAISIKRMIGSLRQVSGVVGSLCGVRLFLVMSEVVLANKAPVWCCHVELREESLDAEQRRVLTMAVQRQEVARAATGAPIRLRVLQPGSEHEDDEEQAAVAQEFHPDPDIVDAEVAQESLD